MNKMSATVQEVVLNAAHATESALEAQQAAQLGQQGQVKTENSVQQAAEAGEMLSRITNAVNIVSDVNAQTATAAEEINKSAVKINEAAQGIANEATKTSAISYQLSEEARRQQQLVAQFQR